MNRFALAWLSVLGAAALAPAHFPFLTPIGTAPGFWLVFNDTPQATEGLLTPEAVVAATYTRVDAAGLASKVPAQPSDGGRFKLDGDAAAVYGTVIYGVVHRGDPQPVLLSFYPKAVGHVVRPGDKPASYGLPLELTPMPGAGGLAFVVTAAGKPLADTDVVVSQPGETRHKVVKTDSAGCTPAFAKGGEYAVRVYKRTTKGGELVGRKYSGERQYATLTVKYEAGQ